MTDLDNIGSDIMEVADTKYLIAGGEFKIMEFKKSTGQLTRTAETLCAFLNASDGTVIFGNGFPRIFVDSTVVSGGVPSGTLDRAFELGERRQVA
jgi:hypothetical protein